MGNSIFYLPKAQLELEESLEFYDEKAIGLGVRFEIQLKEKLLSITKSPESYRKRKGDFRETVVKGFPYLIIYKYYKTKKIVLIASIFHTSRNPKYKYRK